MPQLITRPNWLIATGVLLSIGLMALGCRFAWAGTIQGGASPNPAGAVLLAQVQPPPRQNVETNISELQKKLQITPAQEPQFNAVANVMRDNARTEAGAPQQPPANATAVNDLRAYIRYSELELAGLKKMLPVLDALYATLSP